MNSQIAELIRARIASMTVIDKITGVVRAIPRKMEGREQRFPVGCDVTDPFSCDLSTLKDLVPDGRYRSIIYFEDRGAPQKQVTRTRGIWFTSRLRLICWMDTRKIGPQCTSGDEVMMEMIALIEGDKYHYNSEPFQDIRHRVSIAEKSSALFSRYTYDEANRQFLTPPFDYFGLDIDTSFRIMAACVEPVELDPQPC